MNQETRSRIIAEESAKFLDPSFAQLDLSAFPDLNHPAPEVFATEDRHGLNRVVVSASNQLKALAENPDREALEQIARETGDAGLIERPQDEREDVEAKAFVSDRYEALGRLVVFVVSSGWRSAVCNSSARRAAAGNSRVESGRTAATPRNALSCRRVPAWNSVSKSDQRQGR
jgi:hypothetical protein